MRNRTPIPRAERPPIPDFTPVPRRYRHDGRAFRGGTPPANPCDSRASRATCATHRSPRRAPKVFSPWDLKLLNLPNLPGRRAPLTRRHVTIVT